MSSRLRRVPVAAIVTAVVVVLVLVAFGVALVRDAGDDGAAPTSPFATSPGPPDPLAPIPPAAPVALEARAAPFAVELRWSPDPSGGPIERYIVYRNGREIGSVDGDDPRRFVDGSTLPRLRYVYAVAAIGGDDLASEATELRVTTPSGPVASARLEGTFAVKIDERATFGYRTSGGDASGGWTFTPRCDEGACDVKVARIFRRARGVVMDRRAATYRARGTGQLGVKCAGSPSTSTYRIELRVVKANTVEGVWRAVRIDGTFVHREAAQRGCVAGGADLAFTGKLVAL